MNLMSFMRAREPEKYLPLLKLRTEPEYDAAFDTLTALMAEIGDNPQDPRFRFVETLTVLIEAYDAEHYPIPEVSGVEMLKFLMEQHDLSQSDLPEVGSQGVVSEILKGKRKLNVRQIRALAERFNLSPSVFLSAEVAQRSPTRSRRAVPSRHPAGALPRAHGR